MATNGLVVMTPTSIASTGGTASIGANGKVSFSGCYVLSLNGVFTSDYDNYMIQFFGYANQSTPAWDFRMRASGTDATGTNYTYQILQANGSTVSGSRTTTSSVGRMTQMTATQNTGDTAYIFGPYLAQPTATRSVSGFQFNGASIYDYACTHSLSTSYDGITFTQTSAYTFTGSLVVYGFNQ